MIQFFGHAEVRTALEHHLPPVVLLRGPPSVGKWTLANYLAQYHRVIEADTRRIEKLDADGARELKQFLSTRPFAKRKLVIARIDGSSETSLNALLKILEEPPASVHFLLMAVNRTLDTIMSRSHVHNMGLLSSEDLFSILTQRVGMAPQAAEKAVILGRGQVRSALLADKQDSARATVLTVLKALADGDAELFAAATQGRRPDGEVKWDIPEEELLCRWIVEAITGRWQAFTEAETFGLLADKNMPRRMMLALRVQARPSLKIKAAFAPLLANRRA